MEVLKTTDEVKQMLIINRHNQGGTLSIVGIANKDVVIEIPTQFNPDVNVDEHWTRLFIGGEAQELSVGNNCVSLPWRGVFRIYKPDSSPVAFGIAYK